jgi:hypothetical protein
MMDEARNQFANDFFMEVFILAAWLIWKQRNNLIFNKIRPTFQSWRSGFLEEARLQALRMGLSKRNAFSLLSSPVSLDWIFLLQIS